MGEVIKKQNFYGSSEYILNPLSGITNTGTASILVQENFCIKYVDLNNFVTYFFALKLSLNFGIGTDTGVISCIFSQNYINGVCVANSDLLIQNNDYLYVNCATPAIDVNYHIHNNCVFNITGIMYDQ